MNKTVLIKVLGAILIILSIVIVSIPTNEVVAETSKTSDFQINGTTLMKYTGTAETVSVPSEVKKISEAAFKDNSTVVEVKLPEKVEEIAYSAFSGCNNLKTINIPSSVTTIGTAAFTDCTSLTSVTLPKSLKKLGTGVFTNCNNLTTFSIDKDNPYFSYDDGVIYDFDKKTIIEVLVTRDKESYVMPSSVIDIYPYAFYACKNIKEITFSNNIKTIPSYAFSYCFGVKKLSIPYSVTTIDAKAFENCINLTDVSIPESVTYIHRSAFDGCSKLNILAEDGSYAYNWFKSFDNTPVVIVDNEDNNPVDDDKNEETNSSNVVVEGLLGETVVANRRAVVFIDNLKQSVYFSENSITDNDGNEIFDMEAALSTDTYGKGLNIPKLSVIDNVISGKAFYGSKEISDYEIPSGITSIGDFAFARSNLTSITIPDNVTSIGYGAFYHCDDLSKILVPKSVTSIEASAFAKTRMMENWLLYGESNFLILGDGILVAYKGKSTSVTIPDEVKTIGPEAFLNHDEIREVYISDSVLTISDDAFNGCSNLYSVAGGMNVTKIGDRAFLGCPLRSIRIVDSVKEIGLRAFDYENTFISDEYKNVYFHGDELPALSYGKLSTRLTNSEYREDALNNCLVAIVKSEDIQRIGTVLDRSVSGFSGLICVIDDINNEYFNGTLKIIDCTLTSEEAVSFSVPDSIYVYGKGYNFNKEELENVINMAKEGQFENVSEDSLSDESVNVVTFSDDSLKYKLNISKDTSDEVSKAYKRIYGENTPANYYAFKIEVTDINTNTPISKFGSDELSVVIPLPDNVPSRNLHVICTDENKQLEDLPYKVVNSEGKLGVSFTINHTGHYGVYSVNAESIRSDNLDDSPDTGDLIHPKWFAGLGLLLIALGLLIYKPKTKII